MWANARFDKTIRLALSYYGVPALASHSVGSVTIGAETEGDRDKRRHQRTLFDGIAERYEESRPGYPARVGEFVIATAGLGPGAAVLEIGCGTGQLTERLACHGFHLTAIDIGPSMVAASRRRLAGAGVSFQATSFEDLVAADGSFDLVISSAAFHWIDPEVAFGKSARLLRPGGWLALLGTEERYDHPLGAVLDDLWVRHGDTGGAWDRRPSDPEAIAATALFRAPVCLADRQRAVLTAGDVISLESTRATFLSWPHDTQRQFTAELRRTLETQPMVHLTRHTSVTMAQVPGDRRLCREARGVVLPTATEMTEIQARVAVNALVFGYFGAMEQWYLDGGVRPIATYVEEGMLPLRSPT
jgi:ubiquinone/menaquinone biosynthesis C-methylase UbiE